MRRLDRAYMSVKPLFVKMKVNSRILGGFSGSDHKPLLVICQDSQEELFPSRYRVNMSIFKQLPKRELMDTLLEKESIHLESKQPDPEKVLALCLKRASNQTRSWGKALAIQPREREKKLREAFMEAQLHLEKDPNSPALNKALRESEAALEEFVGSQARWMGEVIAQKCILARKHGNKHVFGSFNSLSKQTTIKGGRDQNGQI
jgi:hypothetical protein